MITRNNPLNIHLTAKDVAEYLTSGNGKNVGMTYPTDGDVWDAKNEVKIEGLLQLILLELRKERKLCHIDAHTYWLKNSFSSIKELLSTQQREIKRISRFVDVSLCGDDCKFESINRLSLMWRRRCQKSSLFKKYGWYSGDDGSCSIREKIKRLKKVKSINDLHFLHGIGKKRKERIIEKNKDLQMAEA